MIAFVVATAIAGCALVQPQAVDQPVPAAPLGPIHPAPGGGPPIECRGVPANHCLQAGTTFDAGASTIRIIVTCEILVCTDNDAAVRVDGVDAKGITTSMGRGTWGNGVQP